MGEREELLHEACFLLDRLEELSDAEDMEYVSEFEGHVRPSMSRLRKIVDAYLSAPAQGPLGRETIARIIAPDDFNVNDGKQIWRKGTLQRQCDEALAKADAILALRAPAQTMQERDAALIKSGEVRAPEAADAGDICTGCGGAEYIGDAESPCPECNAADAGAVATYVNLCQVLTDIYDELGCPHDNEEALVAIDRLKRRSDALESMLASPTDAGMRERAALELLSDVPGEGLVERVGRLIDWYKRVCAEVYPSAAGLALASTERGPTPPKACDQCQNTGWCHANNKCYLKGRALSPHKRCTTTDGA